jgi:hypothetical protein
MKNFTVCKNCQTENPFYELICRKCKGFLRERVFNIDLWKALGLLIETPVKAFKTIIYAEHKNFTVLLLLLASGKFAVDLLFFSILKSGYLSITFFGAYLLALITLIILLIAFSFSIFYFGKMTGEETRIKDNLSILVYSLIPHVFAFVILFPIEIVVFGANLLDSEVSPFVLKPGIAYTLLVIELLVVIWGMFLTAAAVYTQFKNFIISILIAAAFNGAILFCCYFISR